MNILSIFKMWFGREPVSREVVETTDNYKAVSDVIEVSTEQYMMDVDFTTQDLYFRVRSKNGTYPCKIYKYVGLSKNKSEIRRAVRKQYAKDTACPYIEVREILAQSWFEMPGERKYKTA